MGRDDNPASAKKTNAPADRAKDPRLVESPSDEEPVFVIEQVCLNHQYGHPDLAMGGTHHYRHARRLEDYRQNNENTQKPPAILAESLSA